VTVPMSWYLPRRYPGSFLFIVIVCEYSHK
jgi:hypothetical protein